MSDLLTAGEVAEAFRVSRNTVSKWAADGTVPVIRLGGVLRFRRSDIEALLNPAPAVEAAS
jgi:excisionase family DNA binding protein